MKNADSLDRYFAALDRRPRNKPRKNQSRLQKTLYRKLRGSQVVSWKP